MSHTKDVIVKLEESGVESLNDAELRFCGIIQSVSYCSNCNNDINAVDSDGNRICPICSSTVFKTIDIDLREYKCSYCNKAAYPGFYKEWTKLPFVNIDRKSFYCGCRGWD